MPKEWPLTGLDRAELAAAGRRPVPFRQFILKLTSGCNLACDYCYMYTMADQEWRTLPRVMAPAVVRQSAARISEHVSRHGLDRVEVVLHGGEPMLAGVARLTEVTRVIRAAVPATTAVDFVMQTNGTLLDDTALAGLTAAGVRIAVSIDGDDRHRRGPDGASSEVALLRGIKLLGSGKHRAWFAGILCVVDTALEPAAVYARLCALDPPMLDFLLPHATWSRPPPAHSTAAAPYGRWLAEVFDLWYGSRSTRPGIRLFREIIHLILGGRSASEQIGLSPAALVVINVDGRLEQVDTLRASYPGAPATGMTVFADDLEAVLDHPAIVARQLGISGLCDTCRACSLVEVCGGGHYAHRHRPGRGFLNPSVYCADLAFLIRHVRARIGRDVAVLAEVAG
ncbi:FxsB family cyclophane-forming radical SAM/SPASM peptide maturase [Actinoplanes sp. NPDC049599]|uniref:FxsB family cyclophane-forming radical SAM/SPASM peptide maturase n=1 Tax=Actinoplanes sp. NPDC049599 TaxID=3363903 RepID=UPI003795502B